MKANIENITYIENNNKYFIITEFSRLPIESFDTEKQAKDFIDGYLCKEIANEYHLKGEFFRNCIEIDLLSGTEIRKLRDIEELMLAVC